MNNIKIGTSGFSYNDWLGNFYPQFCPKQDYLRYYALKFCTVEIDATFYRIPSKETVIKWCQTTPDSFCFSAKFPQTVTHEGDLDSRISNALAFIDRMKHLEHKLGALLLQFPYSFKPESKATLYKLLEALPDKSKLAIELRNKKWLELNCLFDLLKAKQISFCLIDHPWMPKTKSVTADFVYIRLLGDRKAITEDFSYLRNERRDELNYWKNLICELSGTGKDCFAYINNHYSGHSPSTAEQLREMIQQ